MRTMRMLAGAAVAVAITLMPTDGSAQGSDLGRDLVQDINTVEGKTVALAEALKPAHYAWRPAPGTRTSGEVLLHIAADNYFLPTVWGVAAPASTKINATDFAAVQAYEKQNLDAAATVAALKASFDHLEKAIASVPESRMDEKLTVFGQEFTMRGFLVLATTHLHEHLGQLIAYARTNLVTPPWSQQ